MKFQTSTRALLAVESQMVVIGCFEGENPFGGKAVNDRVKLEGFTGKLGENFLHIPGVMKAQRLFVLGLGPRDKFDTNALRKALTVAFKQAKANKVTEVTIAPMVGEIDTLGARTFAENVATYACLVDYVINHQKTARGGHKPEVRLATVQVLANDENKSEIEAGLEAGRVIGEAVNLSRDLSNLPAAELTPNRLAAEAQKVAAASNGAITAKFYRRCALKRMGARALLAVAQGSDQEPVLIDMTYSPANAASSETLCFIGKSVTFDSGGLDIKSADGMRTMKRDMAGGASTLAAIQAIAALQLPVKVRVIMAATENMVNGSSYKPGDVIKSMAGISIEVDNTDAEGRLTLADAIEYAKRKKVTRIVDLATLTGAVRMLTADVGAAAFGNNDDFSAQVAEAAKGASERLLSMPMWEEFKEANRSKTDMADLANSGGDPGSITAAWFLREFAGEETPWVHMDIAGASYRTRELGPDPKGCTGYGVRTLVELARKYCK